MQFAGWASGDEHLCVNCKGEHSGHVCTPDSTSSVHTGFVAVRSSHEEFDMTDDSNDDVDIASNTSPGDRGAPPGYDTVFRYGQHNGQNYLKILMVEPDYVTWGRSVKKPSLELLHFLEWFDKYYVSDGGRIRRRTRDDRSFPTSSSTPSRKPPSPPLPTKCDVCVDFSGSGSSARYIVRTCRTCGYRTQRERYEAVHRPNGCPHDAVDHRGSTKDVARTFCIKCQTYIDEQPRGLAEGKKETAKKVATATNSQAQAIDKLVS